MGYDASPGPQPDMAHQAPHHQSASPPQKSENSAGVPHHLLGQSFLGHDGANQMSGSMNAYKNPWTSISRPMNGFIDIRQDQWEQNEVRKAQLAQELRQQMDEVQERKDLAKR